MENHTTIGKALKSYLKSSGLSVLLKNRTVLEAWYKIVGSEIAAQTRIIAFRRGVLTIETASSSLYAELRTYYLEDIARSIQKELGNRKVVKIRLRLAETIEEEKNGVKENGN